MAPHQGQLILQQIQDHAEQILSVFIYPIASIEILIQPSGPTAPDPFGRCSPVTINEGCLTQGGLGGAESGEAELGRGS